MPNLPSTVLGNGIWFPASVGHLGRNGFHEDCLHINPRG